MSNNGRQILCNPELGRTSLAHHVLSRDVVFSLLCPSFLLLVWLSARFAEIQDIFGIGELIDVIEIVGYGIAEYLQEFMYDGRS